MTHHSLDSDGCRRSDPARSPRGLRRWASPLAAGLLVLGALPVSADDSPPVSIAVGARFGAFYGVANEYVYDQMVSPDYRISQLVWPLTPMLFSGAALSVDTAIGIFITLDVRQGFSGVAQRPWERQ